MAQVTHWIDGQRPDQATDSSAFPRMTSHQVGHDHPLDSALVPLRADVITQSARVTFAL